jgi:predicted nucleic acid-binding protein
MPANAIKFSDYPSTPKPAIVYVDSNFAIELLIWDINNLKGVVTNNQIECNKFYQRLKADAVKLCASAFTFSETLQFYCFKYPNGMQDRSKRFLVSKGATLSQNPHAAYKNIVHSYPVEAANIWSKIAKRAAVTERFFDRFGIRLISPLTSPQRTNVTKSVLALATILKERYVGLEATDALHLAYSAYLNADAIVSLDAGMREVDSFTVYHLS